MIPLVPPFVPPTHRQQRRRRVGQWQPGGLLLPRGCIGRPPVHCPERRVGAHMCADLGRRGVVLGYVCCCCCWWCCCWRMHCALASLAWTVVVLDPLVIRPGFSTLCPPSVPHPPGNNDYGQLGSNAASPSTAPVAVAGGHVFQAIWAGYSHSCARKADGSAWCWGERECGGGGAALPDHGSWRRGQAGQSCSSVEDDASLTARFLASCKHTTRPPAVQGTTPGASWATAAAVTRPSRCR